MGKYISESVVYIMDAYKQVRLLLLQLNSLKIKTLYNYSTLQQGTTNVFCQQRCIHMCVMIRSCTCVDFNIYTFYFHTQALIKTPFALPPKFLALA